MIEAALVAKALASAPITSLIGTSPMRLSPGIIPRSAALPACAYVLVSDPREEVMGVNAGVRHARVQITCVAATYLDARTVADAFATVFNRYRGTIGGHVIQDTFIENTAGTVETTEGLQSGEGVGLSTLDLLFHYEA